MKTQISANCKCGNLQFTATENPILQVACHCTDCRDATNNAFSEVAFFKVKSTVVTGKSSSNYYVAESKNTTERVKCSECATVLLDKSEGFHGLIGVFTQHIRPPFVTSLNCHVWIKSKITQTVLPSDIAQYETNITAQVPS